LGEFIYCPIVGHKIWSSFCEACGLFGPKCDHTPGDPELAEEFKEHFGDKQEWIEERISSWVEEHWIKRLKKKMRKKEVGEN